MNAHWHIYIQPTLPSHPTRYLKREVPQAPRDLLYKKLTRQHHSAQKQTAESETGAKIRVYVTENKQKCPLLFELAVGQK